MAETTFHDCYCRLDGRILTLGNARIEQRWTFGADGAAEPVSLTDKEAGFEWLQQKPLPPHDRDTGPDVTVQCETGPRSPVAAPSLRVAVTTPRSEYRFEVYPDVPAVVTQIRRPDGGESAGGPAEPGRDDATGIEADVPDAGGGASPVGERLALAPVHLRLTAVTFQDETDRHDELVFEREWLLQPAEKALPLHGNLFSLEETLEQRGLVLLKIAPLPHARAGAVDTAADVVVAHQELTISRPDDYPVAVVLYSGGRPGRTAALQAFQRCLRRPEAGRDGQFLSNTWGDRNRDGRISEAFLREEIAAGARLGVDVLQIDDGWQRGTSANSVVAREKGGVWEGFRRADPDFWAPHPERLPNGLAPLVRAAQDAGLRLGLWFAPDSADDFARWADDADAVLSLHREHGIEHFKIDGVAMRSEVGERNLRAFFDRVLAESGGAVVFDLDVTAQTRPGYFGMPDVGPLFVENRYTDWHRYWPHQTLRNLWKLAQYVDPVRLRMEFLNHARNREVYTGDPLAPVAFSPDYLFATVMMASPLGWFEVQGLPEAYFADAAPLIATWKAHREALHGGTTYPIGSPPDGVVWTGFASVAADRQSAYILAFRGWNDPSNNRWRIEEVPSFRWNGREVRVEVLGGRGTVSATEEGGVTAEVPARNDFVFARLLRD